MHGRGEMLAVPSGMQCVFQPRSLQSLPTATVPIIQWSPHFLLGQNEPDAGFPLSLLAPCSAPALVILPCFL